MQPTEKLLLDYQQLTCRAGLIKLAGRAHIRITGADRASFLHALCTNDVKGLTAGQGCEALFLNASGKVLGHAYAFVGAEEILLDAVPGQRAFLWKHLDFYHFREKVAFTDLSDEWNEWLVTGPEARAALESLGSGPIPDRPMTHVAWAVSDTSGSNDTSGMSVSSGSGASHGKDASGAEAAAVSLRKVDWSGPDGWSLSGPVAAVDAIAERLIAAGVPRCGDEAWEVLRVESGTPFYGVDITADNLPQEVARDSQLISFRKGCYLGQETVARIDSHGHVNRLLRGVKLEAAGTAPGAATGSADGPSGAADGSAPGSAPSPAAESTAGLAAGLTLSDGAKPLAVVTSVVYSPRLAAPLALAYVRRGRHAAATRLEAHPWAGTVVDLPLK